MVLLVLTLGIAKSSDFSALVVILSEGDVGVHCPVICYRNENGNEV